MELFKGMKLLLLLLQKLGDAGAGGRSAGNMSAGRCLGGIMDATWQGAIRRIGR